MKRIISVFLAIALVCLFAQARTFVLVTGVSNYGNENINLSQTTKDAKAFKRVMETQTKDITLLTSSNASRANILSKLKAICNRAQPSDRIIFYFSGHGMPGAICTYDQSLTYDDLVATLETSSAKEKICFIDACHAGSAVQTQRSAAEQDKSALSKAIKGKKGQAFFVGCRGDEYSYENPWVGAGYFTQAAIKGLRGKSDANGDKNITVKELFKYIYNDVTQRSKQQQHPQLIAPAEMMDVVVAKWQ
ncbi:MAG: caspase family protein [Muribaculum sp.]|nr:caspase family protein [Muribaculaceae bacterium]MCM1081434.1 caspase family protein [Muribaculum sp.]